MGGSPSGFVNVKMTAMGDWHLILLWNSGGTVSGPP